MLTISKFELVSVNDLMTGTKTTAIIKLPIGSRVLSIKVHKDSIYAFILLNTDILEVNDVYVQFIGTNWTINFPSDISSPVFIDTVSLYNGDFMFHVFMSEVIPYEEPTNIE